MAELREGDPCPACGAPIWPCECEEPEHLICSGCGNDAVPDEDGEVSCDCPPLDDIDEDGWFIIYLANRGVMSLEWFREANPPTGRRAVGPAPPRPRHR